MDVQSRIQSRKGSLRWVWIGGSRATYSKELPADVVYRELLDRLREGARAPISAAQTSFGLQ